MRWKPLMIVGCKAASMPATKPTRGTIQPQRCHVGCSVGLEDAIIVELSRKSGWGGVRQLGILSICAKIIVAFRGAKGDCFGNLIRREYLCSSYGRGPHPQSP